MKNIYITLLVCIISIVTTKAQQPAELAAKINDTLSHNHTTELKDLFVRLKQNLLQVVTTEWQYWNYEQNLFIETHEQAVDKIKSYWHTVNLHPTTKQIKTYNWQEANPWSAAFISWCIQKAGYDKYFYYVPNHARYIIWARKNKENNTVDNPFWAYEINDKAAAYPQPGDLLCKNRDGKSFTLQSISEYAISHCDIVTETDYTNGIVITVGGNVQDKVNKRWVFLNKEGYIDTNASWLCFDAAGNAIADTQKQFFSVIKVQ